MIRIVKNVGQCRHFVGRCKYLLYNHDKNIGDLYSRVSLKQIIICITRSYRKDFQ